MQYRVLYILHMYRIHMHVCEINFRIPKRISPRTDLDPRAVLHIRTVALFQTVVALRGGHKKSSTVNPANLSRAARRREKTSRPEF